MVHDGTLMPRSLNGAFGHVNVFTSGLDCGFIRNVLKLYLNGAHLVPSLRLWSVQWAAQKPVKENRLVSWG